MGFPTQAGLKKRAGRHDTTASVAYRDLCIASNGDVCLVNTPLNALSVTSLSPAPTVIAPGSVVVASFDLLVQGETSNTPRPPDITMDLSGDELAGITDLFGALSPPKLEEAVHELAFRRGTEFDPSAYEAAVQEAISVYQLVRIEDPEESGSELIAPGPTAFPRLTEDAEDLPHILDVDRRELDRDTVGRQVEERFRGEAARAVADGDEDRMETLLDVSYDLETWAPVDIASVRDRLDAALEVS